MTLSLLLGLTLSLSPMIDEPTAATETAATRGREIYLAGKASGPEIRLVLANADLEMPATSFPCASCHGENGRGTREGGLVPPGIRWQELMRPATVELTGRKRSAYDLESLKKAIIDGSDPAGVELHPGMPRYKMSDPQLADLMAYLRVVGEEEVFDPGVEPELIRFGTVLPLSGANASTGDSIRKALEAWSGQLSIQGIYGRKIEWVFEDSVSTQEGTLAALKRIVEKDVFALIGCHLPPGTEGIEEILAESKIPMIGPVTTTPRPMDPPFRWIYYLLPSFYHQSKSLVEYLCIEVPGTRPTIAVVTEEGRSFDDARSGVIEQMAVFGSEPLLDIVPAEGHFDPVVIADALADSGAEVVIVFARGPLISRLTHRLEVLDCRVRLFTLGSVLGKEAFTLADSVAARTYISYPSVVERRQSDLTWLLYLARDTGFRIDSAAVQGSALASVKLVQDTMERCGRRLSRDLFIEQLEKTQEFRTGLVPPITFSPSRHVGAVGSHVMQINLAEGRFDPVSSWIIPRLAHRKEER
ncbi:MAG: ABC transporter substrate-binding protein [Planctomycetota bacterium]|nr:ABC transporter substrate-binding protein [Planctomycetota bacterium]